MEEEQHLIPIPNSTDSLYERVRAITQSPRTYLAPSIKAILDERDAVKKTGFRFSKLGREYRNGIWLLLPEARFEQVQSEEEVSQAIFNYVEKLLDVSKRIMALQRGDYDGLERCQKEKETIIKEAIPALQNGILYDDSGSLPVKAPLDVPNQKVYSALIGCKPFLSSYPESITELLAYSRLRNPGKVNLEEMMASLLGKPLPA